MKKILSILLIGALLVAAAGCAGMSRKAKGGLIGAGSGAVVGGIIGKQAGNTALGAILGAAVGGAAGAYIGNYMDNQAAEIERDLEGATVTRVGEGIKITFDSGILFSVGKSDLQSAARTNLTNLAGILNKYPDTEVLIEGHTDATGSDESNMTLSSNRAQSVANYLESLQVMSTRFSVKWYGETQPIADNESDSGRASNRRVELAIMANDKLKGVAQQKAGQ
jgi:outer membrane protein OmpA-like peptidoglycan-associated protein